MIDPKYLLSDEQMRDYIANGYLVLDTSLPAALHEEIYRRTSEVLEKEGNPGNNILPRVPQLRQVFEDPSLRGALTSVLGPDYIMHSHRHCHVNRGGSDGGGTHKDSYWGFNRLPRNHRTRWAMLFYYPQDVTIANGPTGVVPGSQNYMAKESWETAGEAEPCLGAAGTAVLVHFDLWHRAFPNHTDDTRFMMKFQFTRMSEPAAPTWRSERRDWPGGNGLGNRHDAMWRSAWSWHRGEPFEAPAAGGGAEAIDRLRGGDLEERLDAATALGGPGASAAGVAALRDALRDEAEPVRLNAGYGLGAAGEDAVDALVDALDDEAEAAGLNAAYGLAAAGGAAEPALIEACGAASDSSRGYAAFALGEMGAGPDAVEAVAGLAGDSSELVRRNAADALGTMRGRPEAAVPALQELLADEDAQVRFDAAYALARRGPEAAPATEALVAALDDGNRYVRNHSVEALQRIGTPRAREALYDFLTISRWCPITNRDSTF
ncbi:MAG: HEAT repeat domain-containing protein [Gemmatimonadaceae bacterium]|nr:HEAT repeat domain-containing protein [Gemmatimonadaceae bacterium]